MTRTIRLFAAAAALAVAMPAAAHHSGAHFDPVKSVTLTGVVKAFDWSNPHAWLMVEVADEKGAMKEWAFECSSINIIARKGWSAGAFKPGDKVVVSARPARDGSPAGLLLTAVGPSGSVLKDHQPTG
jgi:hypothetical protein